MTLENTGNAGSRWNFFAQNIMKDHIKTSNIRRHHLFFILLILFAFYVFFHLCSLSHYKSIEGLKALKIGTYAERDLVHCLLINKQAWICASGLGGPVCPVLQGVICGLWEADLGQALSDA